VLALNAGADVVRESVHSTAKSWRRILPKICLLRGFCFLTQAAGGSRIVEAVWKTGKAVSNEKMCDDRQAFDKMRVAQ
jgi:hypothetical protein